MELNQFDINGLTILWQASEHKQELKTAIEQELQTRILTNKKFSKECFFGICKMKNRAIVVSFIPTSDAFNNYGQNVTIDISLNESEMKEMLKNYSSNPPINTVGQIKAEALITDNLTAKQIDQLMDIGFHTSEVLEILY